MLRWNCIWFLFFVYCNLIYFKWRISNRISKGSRLSILIASRAMFMTAKLWILYALTLFAKIRDSFVLSANLLPTLVIRPCILKCSSVKSTRIFMSKTKVMRLEDWLNISDHYKIRRERWSNPSKKQSASWPTKSSKLNKIYKPRIYQSVRSSSHKYKYFNMKSTLSMKLPELYRLLTEENYAMDEEEVIKQITKYSELLEYKNSNSWITQTKLLPLTALKI